VGVPFPAQASSHGSIRGTLVPMEVGMRETAVTPTVPDAGAEQEFQPTMRERLGIVLFVVAASVATAAWVALIVWGVVKVASSF